MKMESRWVKITGIAPTLGSQPANEQIRTDYIKSKGKIEGSRDDEDDKIVATDEEIEKGITVFPQLANGNLMAWNYQVKGFFKGAAEALGDQWGVKMTAGKFDKFVHIYPRNIPFMDSEGEPVVDPDKVLERPIRINQRGIERVALTASQEIDDWSLTFEVTLMENSGTAKSKAITWDDLEDCLNYGKYVGFSQWHNGGWGIFTWEYVDKPEGEA